MISNKTKITFLWGTAILLLFFVVFFLVWLQKTSPALNNNALVNNQKIPPFSSEDWFYGNKNAEVVLIEYGDFECPACAFYAPLLKKIVDEFAGKVVLVYRHFPLKDIHKNALLSSFAAEAAGKQGKFWEMLEKIYARQQEWSNLNSKEAQEIFEKYAQELGLEEKKFKEDLNSVEVKEKVEKSYVNALQLGFTYTPTFVVNQKVITNPSNYEEFKQVISREVYRKENK